MKSQMTEKEFRKVLLDKAGINVVSEYSDAAVAAARQAGMEFAPEPPAPASEIALSPGDKYLMDENQNFWAQLDTPPWTSVDNGQRLTNAREAVWRYKAYPALRAAAAELARQIKAQFAPGVPPFPPLRAALDALEAALAEGPKP